MNDVLVEEKPVDEAELKALFDFLDRLAAIGRARRLREEKAAAGLAAGGGADG